MGNTEPQFLFKLYTIVNYINQNGNYKQIICLFILKEGHLYTVGKISIWTPADFASLATCKEMCDL